jgi:hypothetical protein
MKGAVARWMCVAVAGLALAGGLAAPALAVPATLSLDDSAPALQETAGGWTAPVGLTNLTIDPVSVRATTTRAGCTLTLGASPAQPTAVVDPALHETLQVNIPKACKADDGAFAFAVSAPGATPLAISPAAVKQAPPPWWNLLAFPIALLAFVLLGCLVLRRWLPPGDPEPPTDTIDAAQIVPTRSPADKVRDEWKTLSLWKKLAKPLPRLPAAWSFKDSWITNLTVVGALLTGVLGSADVAKAFLGKDAGSAIALATVGVAIATGFVGAGAVVMATLRNDRSQMTAGGLVLAAAVTTAGAFGQLWVGLRTGWDLDLDGVQYGLVGAFAIAMVLLAGYWWRTLTLTLDEGTEVIPPTEDGAAGPADTLTAAATVVAELTAREEVPAYTAEQFIAELERRGVTGTPAASGTAPDDDPYPRRRRESTLF